MKNSPWKPFIAALLLVAALIGMFYLPRITIGDFSLRRVNILSDIQHVDGDGRPLAELFRDSIDGFAEERFDSASTFVTGEIYTDTVPKGMVAIEDFCNGQPPIMDKFYKALGEAKNRPVRIAYFGDSFIEGDILTCDLRDLFQTAYGGKGVGFVDICSLTAGYRGTVRASSSGWVSHRANDGNDRPFNSSLQGINSAYYIPSSSSLQLDGQNTQFGNHLSSFNKATVFFTPGGGLTLSASYNGGELKQLYAHGGSVSSSEQVQTVRTPHVKSYYDKDSVLRHDTTWTTTEKVITVGTQSQGSVIARTLTGNMNNFHMSVSGGGSSRFYGVALDGNNGVSLDNFSMRSSPGFHLCSIPDQTMKTFAQLRPYDLIIIQFGLNAASPKIKDYTHYITKMGEAIDKLRAAYPNAAILIVSVSDRDNRGSGGFKTMPGLKEFVSFQRKMAGDHHVAFWNLFEAMGGEGSMAKMVEKKEANQDYTHMNFKGGAVLAKKLFDVLQNGKKAYDGRNPKKEEKK